jgi:hypothetical protein
MLPSKEETPKKGLLPLLRRPRRERPRKRRRNVRNSRKE